MTMVGGNGVLGGDVGKGRGWIWLVLAGEPLFGEWCLLLVFCLIIYIYSMVYIGGNWFV